MTWKRPEYEGLLLCAFEQFFSLKINFYKNKLFCFEAVQNEAKQYAQLLGCAMGELPL